MRNVKTEQEFISGLEGRIVEWTPQAGSQNAFLSSPVFEVLYEGTRGPGKTDALLMDFVQHVGKGYKEAWAGILFRQEYKRLEEIRKKSKKLFPKMFPGVRFNEGKDFWVWPEGEMLYLRQMKTPEDHEKYQGHEYPWIGWEELTTWADPVCYKLMMACCRSAREGMPRKYRATTNPYGVGHNWVKKRFLLPTPDGTFPRIGRIIGPPDGDQRVAIHGHLDENLILMRAEPHYKQRIIEAARNPQEIEAWLNGSWDIVAGGMFDDIWNSEYHVIPNFPFSKIPRRWRLDRSYDYGQAKPHSVGWWAESNGDPIEWRGRLIGYIPGDLIRIGEWYGWTGTDNEGLRMLSTQVAAGILEREADWGIAGCVRPGPADDQIFSPLEGSEHSPASDMGRLGVHWTKADKRKGSRVLGWEQIRKRLKGAIPNEEGCREDPGLFICERCDQFRRTFPVLPRDDKNLDDVNTDAEDHIADETRYRVRAEVKEAISWNW